MASPKSRQQPLQMLLTFLSTALSCASTLASPVEGAPSGVRPVPADAPPAGLPVVCGDPLLLAVPALLVPEAPPVAPPDVPCAKAPAPDSATARLAIANDFDNDDMETPSLLIGMTNGAAKATFLLRQSDRERFRAAALELACAS